MSPTAATRHTPLYDRHTALGAVLVDFAGYAMPQQYVSIRSEHLAVRERAGLFDISHMGEVRIHGDGALETLQRLCANDISRLTDGRALYGVMCNDSGGIIDDIIVYRDTADDFMVVINAGCHDKDVRWMRDHLAPSVQLDDLSDAIALLAVQGPRATGLVNALAGDDVAHVRPFHCTMTTVAGRPARISRTGYTGEDGFELYVADDDAPAVWDALMEAGPAVGLQPCGLGSRDTLRLEAGLRLYGQDMDDSIDPYSAGLGWTVKVNKGIDCIGATALRRIALDGPPRRFIGLALEGRSIARHGQAVMHGDTSVGSVTSGTYSFTLGHGIATASIDPALAPGLPVNIDIRGRAAAAVEVALPFYRRPEEGSSR